VKFKIDENLPIEITLLLRSQGFDTHTVLDEGLRGSPDDIIMERIEDEERILVTMDKGIANIKKYSPTRYAGIILLRPRNAAQDSGVVVGATERQGLS
jgi:predicted nuclease of predicted toxin-antitoxin system